MTMRPISITHLVFGLIFLGLTALWIVGETTDAEAPALAIWGPVVLIGAGLVGLAAIVFNARTARTEPADESNPEYAGTGVVHDEEQS